MKIKSILLGSAAAITAVSTTKAADAVIFEPDPVEYVRVCDTYGAGFFYIPGTETCMKFSGYVRSFYKQSSRSDLTAKNRNKLIVAEKASESSQWKSRARLDLDTRSETDWGTLRSNIRLQANAATDDGKKSDLEIDQAIISLAGFRAGIGPSLFNANNAVVNLEGVAGEDFEYGYSNGHVADYTFSINGFSAAIGVEDAEGSDANDVSVLANFQYDADYGTIGYVGEMEKDKDIAHKVYADFDLSEYVSGGKIGGWYMWEDLHDRGNNKTRIGAENVWGIGLQMDLTDDVEFVVLHSQKIGVENTYALAYNRAWFSHYGRHLKTNLDKTGTTIGLNWKPVEGLKVFGSYTVKDWNGKADYNYKHCLYYHRHTCYNYSYPMNMQKDENMFTVGLKRSF